MRQHRRINIRYMRINKVVEDQSFSLRNLIIKTSRVGLVESVRLVARGRMNWEIKVSQMSLEEASKLKRILCSGHFIISVRDNI